MTGAQLVGEWKNDLWRRGWVVDRDLPPHVFEPLEIKVQEWIERAEKAESELESLTAPPKGKK